MEAEQLCELRLVVRTWCCPPVSAAPGHLGMEAQEFKASLECIRDSLSHIKIKIIIKRARKVGEVSEGHVKIGGRQPRDLSRTQDKISDAQRRLGQDRVLCVALKRVVIAIKHYFKIHHGNKSNKKCMPL